jgi:glucosylceramidase
MSAPASPPLSLTRWVASDGVANWVAHAPPAWQPADAERLHAVELDLAATAQVIDGFGGCFNERGWDSLDSLDEPRREQILRDLFAPDADGCRFNLARTPIGASDYAMDWYSLADTPEDYALRDFSIARDQKYLLPYIRAARRHNPALALWASPWCPPAWMKQNGRYDHRGGLALCRLRAEPRVLEAYARYFVRYLQAYRAEGIPIYAIHVQNEPASGQIFPSCEWTGEALREFLRDYLIPALDAASLRVELWLGTINHGDVRAYAGIVLADPQVRARLTGLGYQWDGKHAIAHAAAAYPDMKLMQTESECGNGSNDKAAGLYTYGLLCHYLKRGAHSYFNWNLVLDPGGLSTWSWPQNSLVTIDRKRGEVSYNFEFHVYRHISRFVRAGARRLLTRGADDHTLAFLNPDGSVALVVLNPRYTPMDFRLRLGDRMVRVTLPPETLHTFELTPAA